MIDLGIWILSSSSDGAPGRIASVRAVAGRRPRRLLARGAATLVTILILAGCASPGGYYKDDGPPKRPPADIQSIPDATPRDEPLSRTGNDPYVALGQRYSPMRSVDAYKERGTASWYGKKFHGKRTSSGEPYDMYKMTAAHRTLPLPSYVRVSNLKNGKSIIVRVNDRGPFLHDRLIDLSYAAAYKLGIVGKGTARVEVEVVTAAGPGNRVATADPGPTADAPVQEVAADADRYFVQFGAFSESANAQSMMRKLQQIGIGFAHIKHGDDGYFRVRSGPFSSSSTAERILMRGVDYGLNTTIVMEDSKP